jgi:hypothetical protein
MQERIAAASRSCSDAECLAAWAPGVESGSLMRTSLSLLLAGAAALLVATCGDSAKLPEQATGIPIDVLTGFVSDDEKGLWASGRRNNCEGWIAACRRRCRQYDLARLASGANHHALNDFCQS